MYGYEIMKAVLEGSKGKTKITEAALYPALHRLEEAEFLITDSKEVEGRVRKYYKLSRSGRKECLAQVQQLEERIADLKRILKYTLKKG